MRPDSARWDRAAEVRAAAEGWRRVGAIGEPTLDAINSAFPDPCIRPSLVWRALTAGMVTAVVLCTFGAFWIAIRAEKTGLLLLLLLFAGACLVATERMDAAPHLARRGAAGATSFWAVVLLLAGTGLFLVESVTLRLDDALDAVLATGILAWGASAWRWGNWLFAGLSALSLFIFLARLPHGRVLCILGGVALAGLAAQRLDSAAWAPSHRRAATVVVVTALVAAYAAVNVYSLDARILEGFGRSTLAPAASLPRLFVLSAVGTALVPLVLLTWGIRSRRTFLIDTGVVFLGLSLVTLRYYVHIAPVWMVLTVSGAALFVLALAVERALRRAPGGEIAGLTADPLFSDVERQQALQIVPVVATLTPPAPSAPVEDKDFAGGGGRFGGGGAAEKF